MVYFPQCNFCIRYSNTFWHLTVWIQSIKSDTLKRNDPPLQTASGQYNFCMRYYKHLLTVHIFKALHQTPWGEMIPPSKQLLANANLFSYLITAKSCSITVTSQDGKNKEDFKVFYNSAFKCLKARDWHFGFETSRFWNFCQFFEGFSFGFGKFGLGKKVSVLVSEKFGLGKKSRFWFQKIWFLKKVSVSEKFGLGKKSRFRFQKIWSWKRENPNNK